ncbi:DUF3617 domain-containing protein [Qipengyuania sp. 6B39]|uniref:DUF3617 domain-containing protein n=1 Tax=Qipengyuania proteolytica TaxID=2867239 RepID=UPI001C894161|nr:DUF3617 domain-containing protein [Qipengyuania proteolytica]MBX7495312.1 DUF3617 domain-containing protein [Qipengyuania proteolytica]
MRRIVIAAAASFTLAACGGGTSADTDGDGEITMEEAASKAGDMVKPQPGKYRATVEFVDIDMPGAPQQVQDMMRGMFDQGPQTHEYCLTKEEAEKGFEEMAKRAQEDNGECSFEKFDVEGGSIDAVMNCKAGKEGTARMTMTGTGSETSSQMTMVMNAETPDGQSMAMTMKSSQERIGDCDG